MACTVLQEFQTAFRPERALGVLMCLVLLLPTPMAAAQAEGASSEMVARTEQRALEHRADQLTEALDANHKDHRSMPWMTGVYMVIGTGLGTVGLLGLADVIRPKNGMALFTASGATAVVGGIATFAATDSLKSALFGATLATSGGLLALALDRDVGMDYGYHTWPAGVGAFTTAALVLLDAALSPSPGNAALSRDFERLSGMGSRDSLTESEVAAIERRYVASRPVISRWVMVTPTAIGFVTSGIWSIADRGPADAITAAILGGGLLAQTGALLRWALQRDEQDADMAEAGFDMALVPTGSGAALVGRF